MKNYSPPFSAEPPCSEGNVLLYGLSSYGLSLQSVLSSVTRVCSDKVCTVILWLAGYFLFNQTSILDSFSYTVHFFSWVTYTLSNYPEYFVACDEISYTSYYPIVTLVNFLSLINAVSFEISPVKFRRMFPVSHSEKDSKFVWPVFEVSNSTE